MKILFEVGDLFSIKESTPTYLRSFVVCRFICPGYDASSVGEIIHHLTAKVKQHL